MDLGKVAQLFVEDEAIEEIYSVGRIHNTFLIDQPVNSYYILRSEIDEKKTCIARLTRSNTLIPIGRRKDKIQGLHPKDSKQAAFLDSLVTQDIQLSVGIGPAGTGKSLLAMAYAIQQFQDHQKKIVLAKPATWVGAAKAFGPVPGSVSEKLAPFMDSYKIVLKKILGEQSGKYIDMLFEKGEITFVPIEYMRGCTYENCTLIADETQNLSWHELNTIVSRVGENSKLILLGDLNQIDVKLHPQDTGLYQLVNTKAFSASELSSVVFLTETYRSRIAQLALEADQEIKNERGKSSNVSFHS